jgi:nicotinamide-nucleotide amidase
MIPRGATVLDNRHGTAPGLWLEDDRGRWCAMLPGVPREMRGMLADELLPRIRERLGSTSTVVRSRTLRTTGIGESNLAELIAPVAHHLDGLSLAYLPGADGVDLRVTSRNLPSDATDALLARGIGVLRERATRYAYADDHRDLAAVVLELCEVRNLHIGVAESCTGGLLGARLTAIPGSSTVVEGGVIAYSNSVKTRLLGVAESTLTQHGAVSEQTAREMASGIRARLGVEIGVGITGVAGPGGGTPEKPVGLVWIAADVSGQVRAIGPRLIGDRSEIRYRATQAALDLVRRMVAD